MRCIDHVSEQTDTYQSNRNQDKHSIYIWHRQEIELSGWQRCRKNSSEIHDLCIEREYKKRTKFAEVEQLCQGNAPNIYITLKISFTPFTQFRQLKPLVVYVAPSLPCR